MCPRDYFTAKKPATAYRLTDNMESFVVVHQSAMEQKLSSGIHKGCPFGGTAVLAHNKSLSKFTHHLITDSHVLLLSDIIPNKVMT